MDNNKNIKDNSEQKGFRNKGQKNIQDAISAASLLNQGTRAILGQIENNRIIRLRLAAQNR